MYSSSTPLLLSLLSLTFFMPQFLYSYRTTYLYTISGCCHKRIQRIHVPYTRTCIPSCLALLRMSFFSFLVAGFFPHLDLLLLFAFAFISDFPPAFTVTLLCNTSSTLTHGCLILIDEYGMTAYSFSLTSLGFRTHIHILPPSSLTLPPCGLPQS
jgi:hypothetical protein